MATIVLSTYPAQRSSDGGLQVIFGGGPVPFPAREIEAKRTADALAALDVYKADAAAAGVPLVATIGVKRGSRAPAGFKAATERPYYHPVNV